MRLQNEAKEEACLSEVDLVRYRSMLIHQNLGGSYYVGYIADKLMKLGFDLRDTQSSVSMEYAFFRRLGHFAMYVSPIKMNPADMRPLSHHTLREIKHNCRVPIKKGWLLPGIADEGPAYEAEGETNVYALQPGEIYGDKRVFSSLVLYSCVYTYSLHTGTRRRGAAMDQGTLPYLEKSDCECVLSFCLQ
jgi:RNA-dependent RNA polymerase